MNGGRFSPVLANSRVDCTAFSAADVSGFKTALAKCSPVFSTVHVSSTIEVMAMKARDDPAANVMVPFRMRSAEERVDAVAA